MPRAAALAARCGFPLSPQLHRGISASGPALPGAAETYGTASMLDPSRPELEFRIHLSPGKSLQTIGSASGGAGPPAPTGLSRREARSRERTLLDPENLRGPNGNTDA